MAYIEADKHNWNPSELNAYYDSGAREADRIQERNKAEQKGEEKGKRETAQNLKKLGISNEIIKQSTGLSDEEIESL